MEIVYVGYLIIRIEDLRMRSLYKTIYSSYVYDTDKQILELACYFLSPSRLL